MLALNPDVPDVQPSLIRLHQAGAAKHVVEVCIGRQGDIPLFEAVPCHADRHRHDHRRLSALDPHLCSGSVDPHLAIADQLLPCLYQQADLAVWPSSDGGLGLLHTGLVGLLDHAREQPGHALAVALGEAAIEVFGPWLAKISDVFRRKHVVQKPSWTLGVPAVLALRVPGCYRCLDPATKVTVALMNRRPCLTLAPDLQVKDLADVVAESTDEGGVLPARAVARAAEAIDGAVLPTLHDDVALELLQSLQRHFQRMLVQTSRLGVVVALARWEIAHGFGEPVEQPLSQRAHLEIRRQPVENLVRECFHREQTCYSLPNRDGSFVPIDLPDDPSLRRGGTGMVKGVAARRL